MLSNIHQLSIVRVNVCVCVRCECMRSKAYFMLSSFCLWVLIAQFLMLILYEIASINRGHSWKYAHRPQTHHFLYVVQHSTTIIRSWKWNRPFFMIFFPLRLFQFTFTSHSIFNSEFFAHSTFLWLLVAKMQDNTFYGGTSFSFFISKRNCFPSHSWNE